MAESGRGREVREQLDELIPDLYQDLKRIARRRLAGERSEHTLQPTSLAHETYLRLAEQRRSLWHSREHLLAAAANAMRRVLVDHAREKGALKRGGDADVMPLEEELLPGAGELDIDLVALDEALERLEAVDPAMVRLVELRYFAGLTLEETATALGVSPATVKREWAVARAWLFRALAG